MTVSTLAQAQSEFFSPAEVAERWHCTRQHLSNMRSARRGPAYLKIGGSVLYRVKVIEAFEQASEAA